LDHGKGGWKKEKAKEESSFDGCIAGGRFETAATTSQYRRQHSCATSDSMGSDEEGDRQIVQRRVSATQNCSNQISTIVG
jgi:hypothetical protein